MCLACGGKEVPKKWEHDPIFADIDGCTVAMYLARRRKEVPKQWYHDPTL
jgi:hypothetical protein